MMEPGELKPCPFCGETDLRVAFSHEAGRWDIWEVECEACCVSKDGALGFVGEDARKSAIDAWNSQPALEAALLRISELEGALRTFADHASIVEAEELSDLDTPDFDGWSLLASDFRRARAVLSPLGG
jgi:Lar family restriction alleviation protein